MSNLHIYTERFQPATRWTDHYIDPPMTFTGSPYRLIYCRCCDDAGARLSALRDRCVMAWQYQHGRDLYRRVVVPELCATTAL